MTASPPQPRSRYSLGSTSNVLRSLLVIGFFVAVLVAIVPRVNEVDRPAVDAGSKARHTAQLTGWPIELPAGLPSGWEANVASHGPTTDKVPTFTTVWSTPGGGDISLKQAAAPTTAWLERSVGDLPRSGSVSVGTRQYERYAAQDGERVSYVARVAGSGGVTALTLVATSTGGDDELRTFLAALRPVPPAS